MDVQARIPSPLSGKGDMNRNWRMWKEDFEVYLKVTGYDQQTKENRAYLLRNQIGTVGHEIIEKLMNEEQFNKNDVDVLLEKLELHFNPHKSEVEERYKFFMRSRRQYETIEDYVSNLTELSKTCNFGDMTDSLIRDRVIASIVDVSLRNKCFATDNLDLSKVMYLYKQHQKMVTKNKQVLNNRPCDNRATHLTNANGQAANNQQLGGIENRRPCWRCKQRHPVKRCPAWGHRCNNCGQVNHLTICCKNSNTDNKEKEEYTTSKVQANEEGQAVKKQECPKAKENPQDNLSKGTTMDATPLPPRPSLYPSAPPLSEVEDIKPSLNAYTEYKSSTIKQVNDRLSMLERLQKAEKLKETAKYQKQSPSPHPKRQVNKDECRIF